VCKTGWCLSNRIGGGGGGIVKGTSLFFLLNIMIRSSPTCLIKKKPTLILTRIGIRGTTPHRLERPKKRFAMTRSTILKILEDHDVVPRCR
jgi:hypothetical protein